MSRAQRHSKTGAGNASAEKLSPDLPPFLSRTRCKRMMYDLLCREYYWPHIVNSVYQAIKDCQTCPNQESAYWRQRHPKLFPAAGALAFVAIEISAPFPMPSQGIQFAVFITDCYWKLTKAIQTAR